jgi:hypothetical protein
MKILYCVGTVEVAETIRRFSPDIVAINGAAEPRGSFRNRESFHGNHALSIERGWANGKVACGAKFT